MKTACYKLFTIGQHEKEEAWLNEMAAKGMMLSEAQVPKYYFEEDAPGKYIYRLELLEHLPSHPESIGYIHFLEDAGIQYIGSFKKWVYFRRPAQEGAFELYSDTRSKLKHYERITSHANLLSGIMFGVMVLILGLAWRFESYTSFLSEYIESSRPLYYPYLFWAAVSLLLIILIQCIVIPVRRSIRVLRKESTLRE